MSWLIVFLLSASYCSKEKLDSTKKLNDYAATTSNMKTSSHAVASAYELESMCLSIYKRVILFERNFHEKRRRFHHLPHYIRRIGFGMCSK